jgi:DNA repair exonuclease SbcCD nuclease subunit
MQPIKFLHIADVHLGNKQYNLDARFRDFNRAFKESLDIALRENVDFILLAGDLFEDNRLTPDTLSAAYTIISKFQKEADKLYQREIPIIAIEGNHDMTGHFNLRSWLQFLSDLGLIYFLSDKYDKETDTVIFEPFSIENHRGGLIKIKDCNIYGVRYYGSYVEKILPAIEKGVIEDPDRYNILMMHFGISKEVKNEFGIDIGSSNLQALHDKIDYLALGHFHKQYIRPTGDEWIFNPGSLELNEISDMFEGYDRGMFVVTITGKKAEDRQVKIIKAANGRTDKPDEYSNRNFFVLPPIDIGLSNLGTFQKTLDYVIGQVRKFGLPYRDSEKKYNDSDLNYPILTVFLKGTISYSKLELNIKKIQESLKELFAVLEVRVNTGNIDSQIDGILVDSKDDFTIQQIETQVFEKILEKNPEYAQEKDTLIPLLQELKNALLDTQSNPQILKDQIKMWWKSHKNPGLMIIQPSQEIEIEQPKVTTTLVEENSEQEKLPNRPISQKTNQGSLEKILKAQTKKSAKKSSTPKKQSLDELFDDIDFEKKI